MAVVETTEKSSVITYKGLRCACQAGCSIGMVYTVARSILLLLHQILIVCRACPSPREYFDDFSEIILFICEVLNSSFLLVFFEPNDFNHSG